MENAKILIIEDDAMISSMYKTRLEQEGHIVFVAENGSRGLEMAVREDPNLILLDIMIPQIDGFTLLQELRLKKQFENTPIVLLTNLGTSEDMDKGEKMGATDYLVKANLTPTEVSKAVAKYLIIK